jgi:hypothetical protein
MASRAENRAVNLAGLVQGITLVTFPAEPAVGDLWLDRGCGGRLALLSFAVARH